MTPDPLALVAAMPLPKPAGFRMRYRSEPGMIGHYPWAYADQKRRRSERPEHEIEDLHTAETLRSERLKAAELVLAQGGNALHAAIMNIAGSIPVEYERLDASACHNAYRRGHRDARQAAAELALGGAVLAQGEPVAKPAVRVYWHAHDGWRVEWIGPMANGGQSNYYYAAPAAPVNAEAATASGRYDNADQLLAALKSDDEPVNAEMLAALKSAYHGLSLMLSYHGQGSADYADAAQFAADKALTDVDAAIAKATGAAA